WSFFIPAVDRSKAQALRWFGALAAVLAAGGLAFAYFVVLPNALRFLTNYDSKQLHALLNARDFLGFCVHVELAMMVVFELPVFIVGLTRLGIMTTQQ